MFKKLFGFLIKKNVTNNFDQITVIDKNTVLYQWQWILTQNSDLAQNTHLIFLQDHEKLRNYII